MKIRCKCPDGKLREYEVAEYACKKRKCFVPFEGNGQRICRLYELGQCPSNPDDVKRGCKPENFQRDDSWEDPFQF